MTTTKSGDERCRQPSPENSTAVAGLSTDAAHLARLLSLDEHDRYPYADHRRKYGRAGALAEVTVLGAVPDVIEMTVEVEHLHPLPGRRARWPAHVMSGCVTTQGLARGFGPRGAGSLRRAVRDALTAYEKDRRRAAPEPGAMTAGYPTPLTGSTRP